MRISRAALLAAATALSACAPRALVVTVDGWAAEEPGRAGQARRRAVADALRRAVERGSGVRLSARTRVRDGVAVSERVTADAAGCVLGYEVVSEGSRDGGRSARVRARVAAAGSACAAPPASAATPVSV